MSIELSFGNWLRQRRAQLGVTQEGLSDHLGFSSAMLRKLESGERRPSSQIASLLAVYFRIPADEREAFVAFARTGQTTTAHDEVTPSDGPSLPPWRLYAARRTNLPAVLTSLIGRTNEQEMARDILLNTKTRLLTLTGTAGIGKTHLALQIASSLLEEFEEGAYFVDLSPFLDPDVVLPAVARALGLKEEGSRSIETILLEHVRERRMLLVLDNFEQVLDAATALVSLMRESPWIKVLVTSREALRVRGERRFPVPPLAVPDPKQLPPVAVLARYPSIALFTERAQEVEPGFVLDQDNAEDVAALCAGLEGLPLAIELAASHANHLTPAEMRSGLDNPLELLTGGSRDAPGRHRTLRGAIEWSYNLLDMEEQRFFRCLGVFVGGFTAEAISAIYEHTSTVSSSTIDGVMSLVDKHLVREERRNVPSSTKQSELRFRLLEAIREYALEKMEQHAETEEIGSLHAAYYLALAEGANNHFIGPQEPGWGIKQIEWIDIVEGEFDNMIAALDWYHIHATREGASGTATYDSLEKGLRLATALSRVWFGRGHAAEGLQQLMAFMSLVPEPVSAAPLTLRTVYTPALVVIGRLASVQSGDISWVRNLLEESIDMAAGLGDRPLVARASLILGAVVLSQGHYLAARNYQTESLRLFRELGNKWGAAAALQDLGQIEMDLGNLSQARTLLEESLALFNAVSEEFGEASILASLAYIAYYQEDYATAQNLGEQSLQWSRKIGYKRLERFNLVMLGWIALREGRFDLSRDLLSAGLRASEAGTQFQLYWCLLGLGALERAEHRALRATMLLSAADALHRNGPISLSPAQEAELAGEIAAARAQLTEGEWDQAWARGSAMTLEEAVLSALGQGEPEKREPRVSPMPPRSHTAT